MQLRRFLACTVLLSAALRLSAAAPDPLELGFVNPPSEARPLVWWHWINGNITHDGIDKDLAEMKRVGIGGAQMFDVSIYLPPGPIRYGSDAWHAAVQHAIAKADELGLEFYMMNTPGWSASGGPWVTPERSMKQVVWSETAAGGGAVSLRLAQPTTKLGFYSDIAVFAVPADTTKPPLRVADLPAKTKMAEKSIVRVPLAATDVGAIPRNQVLNVTQQFDARTQTLNATLPAGAWTILRFGFTSTGSQNHPAADEGHGLEIDKMNADDVSFYFDRALGRVIKEAGPRVGRTFRGILFDSFEGGPQNWTGDFPQQFRALKGYDILPFLPALAGRVIESNALTECFLHDFRSAVEESIAHNYFGTMQRRAHEHGMIIYAEAQGGPLNPMSANQYVDVPMNEFWLPDSRPRAPRIKMVASAADILGRRIIAAESFTAKPEDGAWQAVPSNIKGVGDTAWAAGINRFVLHHAVHQPTDYGPGFGLGRYGTHFGRLNTWWPLAQGWVQYVARSQFLLQQGRTVADICFLQNEDHGYSFPSAMVNVPPGYDFDILYPQHVANLTWRDGALRLPTGPAYRLIVLPQNWAADLATLRKLRELAKAGAPIIGPAPAGPAGVRDYEAGAEFDALVGELWGAGDGRTALVHNASSIEAAVQQLGLAPDLVGSATASAPLAFRHRRTADADIYFVCNTSAADLTTDVTLRIADRQPELWDPVAGVHGNAPVFRADAASTTVPLTLEPNGSMFILFRHSLPSRWITAIAPVGSTIEPDRVLVPRGATVTVSYSDAAPHGRSQGAATASSGVPTVLPTTPLPSDTELSRPWRVAFVDGRGAPAEATFATLHSWPEDPNPGIKYYSGVAVYRTTFTAPAPAANGRAAALLDLGTVADLAEVMLNGRSLGVLWHAPFRADVTRLLREGENTLEVRVANRWINRIIGDESLPTDLKYQAPGTNKFTDGRLLNLPAWLYDRSKLGEKHRYSFTTWKHYNADSPLVPSGLIGPVRIQWQQVITP